MSLLVLALVKNEMERFLPSALRAWATFADDVIILDDSSTDGSRETAEAFGAHVFRRETSEAAWGREATARKALFDLGWAHARIDDYLLVLDADMTPAKDPRVLMESEADAVAFNLYDIWKVERQEVWDHTCNPPRHDGTSERIFYRADGAWKAHLLPRVWMWKKTRTPADVFMWTKRGVHCGHLPNNIEFASLAYAPPDHGLLHMAYATPELRADKYAAYARVASDLTDFEIAHARSIMDEKVELKELTFVPDFAL